MRTVLIAPTKLALDSQIVWTKGANKKAPSFVYVPTQLTLHNGVVYVTAHCEQTGHTREMYYRPNQLVCVVARDPARRDQKAP